MRFKHSVMIITYYTYTALVCKYIYIYLMCCSMAIYSLHNSYPFTTCLNTHRSITPARLSLQATLLNATYIVCLLIYGSGSARYLKMIIWNSSFITNLFTKLRKVTDALKQLIFVCIFEFLTG